MTVKWTIITNEPNKAQWASEIENSSKNAGVVHAVIAQLVRDVGYNCRRGNVIYQVSTVLLAMVTVAKY